jgi:phage-related minor tail protein
MILVIKYHVVNRTVQMSTSKKQDRKEDSNTSNNITETYSQLQREQEQAITKALDESKDNIRKTTNEARREIPRYTDVVSDYQENTVQAIREVADSYIESQKDIIVNSYQLWSNWMISPRQIAEDYSNAVSTLADNAISATRLANNAISANLQAFNASVQTAKENAKELSKIGGSTIKAFQQVSKHPTDRVFAHS